ncbi:MAG TPA: efflux RND transporter periplasmic adaptor subunit [Acidimicrobiales bacterium]|nr:efflux RND transporter periplasmic adaptor subunit [Acidimicrobiales bacterium]
MFAVVVFVAVAVVAFVVLSRPKRTAATVEHPTVTAAVQRGPLSTMVSGAGTLTYAAGSDGSPLAVVNRASGTYTTLPSSGDKVDCGEVMYRVDDRPVVLLCGAVPAYRDLRVGDSGVDVRQLNQNLHQLGYDAGSVVDPNDNQFSANTQTALNGLQEKQGLDVTGTLGVADAVFIPWSVRVADVAADLGAPAQPGAAVLRVTSDILEVQIELDATEQEAVAAGDTARITLPGNTTTTGKLDRLGRIAKTPDGPNANNTGATIGAYISLDHPEDARGLDKAPVQVEITTKGVDDALSVPVTAIFGYSGGGFAVEIVRSDTRRDLVPIKVGLFDTAGGRVQVDGDIHEGDRVVVPPS